MFCRHLCSTSFAAVAGPGPSRPPPRAAVTAPSARRATIAVVPHSAGKGLVGGPAGGEGAVHPDPSQPLYPGFQEEKDVSHQAFLHAFEAARPRAMSIPGMQEFAASIWNRRRSIPSQTYADPLDHIFNEARGCPGARSGGLLWLEQAFFHLGFDTDSDGKLTAGEIAKALAARGVAATEAQVQMFIEDTDSDHLVSRQDFPSFIFHMASADLRSVSTFAARPPTPTQQQQQQQQQQQSRVLLPPLPELPQQ